MKDDVVMQQSEISTCVSIEANQITDTMELLGNLEKKLNVVLSSEPTKNKEDEPCPPSLESILGNMLREQNDRLSSINKGLRSILQRIKL